MAVEPKTPVIRNYRCTNKCPETLQAVKMPAERKPEPCKGDPQGKHDWVWDK